MLGGFASGTRRARGPVPVIGDVRKKYAPHFTLRFMKKTYTSITTTLAAFLFMIIASIASLHSADSKNEQIGYWSLKYDKKNPDDWSEESRKVWSDKSRYDDRLYIAGKVFISGIFKPNGDPNNWVVILQPMTKKEAIEIMNNDPSFKAGLSTAFIEMFVVTNPAPGGWTKYNEAE